MGGGFGIGEREAGNLLLGASLGRGRKEGAVFEVGFLAQVMDKTGEKGKKNNEDDDGQQVFVHDLGGDDATQEVAKQGDTDTPERPTYQVVSEKSGIVHVGGASDDGSEGTNEGHETSENDGNGSVFFVKSVGFVEVVLFKDFGVGARENFGADAVAEGVADVVA